MSNDQPQPDPLALAVELRRCDATFKVPLTGQARAHEWLTANTLPIADTLERLVRERDEARALLGEALEALQRATHQLPDAALLARIDAALAGPVHVCRNFSPWGCTEDERGERVDPRSCRVCGGTKRQHDAALGKDGAK